MKFEYSFCIKFYLDPRELESDDNVSVLEALDFKRLEGRPLDVDGGGDKVSNTSSNNTSANLIKFKRHLLIHEHSTHAQEHEKNCKIYKKYWTFFTLVVSMTFDA